MTQPHIDIKSCQNSLPHTRGTVYKGNVLIVDDEVDVLNAMQEYLTACGYMAVGCTSGKEAIEKLKTRDFEIMLTDLMMPEMNGVELLKSAKEIDPYLMGIIVTGKGTLETTTEMMKEVAFLCSLKPFSFRMMQMIIHCAIRARKLTKLEEKYHLLTGELTSNELELQNCNEQTATKELEILEMKREIDELKEELQCYEYLEKHWKQ